MFHLFVTVLIVMAMVNAINLVLSLVASVVRKITHNE